MIPLHPDHAKLMQAYREHGETPHPGEITTVVTFRHKVNALLDQLHPMAAQSLDGVLQSLINEGKMSEQASDVAANTAMASFVLAIVRATFNTTDAQHMLASVLTGTKDQAQPCWASVHADITIHGIADNANVATRVKFINALREIVGRRAPRNAMGTPLVSDVDLMCAGLDEWREAVDKAIGRKGGKP